jgi:antitoxin MazE
MKVKVAKWGNSLGVRLPKAALDGAGVGAGSELDLVIERGGFRLKAPTKTSADLLAEMVAEMKRLGGRDAEPETVDWGRDRGEEILPEDAYSRGEITFGDLTRKKPSRAAKRQKAGHHAAPRRRRHRLG